MPPAASRGRAAPGSASRVFTWHFLAANNRRLAVAAATYERAQPCLDAIRALQDGLPAAVEVLVQVTPSNWMWRVAIAGSDHAVSGHGYARRVRAQLACRLFLEQVATTRSAAIVPVRYL
jgi:hypothetical protein